MAKLTYFKGRGRAETTRWMLAINQISFENIAIANKEELAALRGSGKLPFDQMPLLEIDGLCLSQSSAMVRYLARKGGFYGDNDSDAWQCDLVAGAVADFAETALQAAFQPTAAVAIAGLEVRFGKFGPRFEARLAANGAAVSAGSRLSFADVVLAEALSNYLEWCPDILDATPLLKDLYGRVTGQPGVARYLASDLRYAKPDDQYILDVALVLGRALPPHMPDPDRFVTPA
ncbi:MAG: glutathione S-transferase family protein [Rhodospirillales bacterium]|nr:glutathione S-transferase family protein [Rhodospirillales bacterium]